MTVMRKTILLSTLAAALSLTQLFAQAPEKWSLEKCITHARENNITIKRQKLNADYTKNEYSKAKYDRLPNLNANSSYRLGFGKYFDPIKREYQDETEVSQSLYESISSNTTLFQGFAKANSIQMEHYNLLAAIENVKKSENEISLQIATHYLQILFDKELLAVSYEQLNITNQQVDRAKKMVDAGSQAMGSYLEIKAQAAKEALNVARQENSLALSLLNLAQLLDLEEVSNFDVLTPVLPEMNLPRLDTPEAIFSVSEGIMPQIKSSSFKLTSSEYQLKMTKGYLWPSLSFGAEIATQASKINGSSQFNLKNSFSDNLNSYIGFSVNIPIFNGLQTRYNIKNAQIGVWDAQYQLAAEKLNLRKDIQQAWADANAAYKKYLSSQEAVNSYEESFRYTEKRFSVGLINPVDYNTAKNEYTRAQSELLQAKYEYILRTKIIDFYQGIPLQL
jgi:outer membrane protein